MGFLEPHVRHRSLFRVAVSRNLDDVKVARQRVLLRADLNVPMQGGEVSDLTRLERLVPTIRELSTKGARVIVLSHFDRPKGKVVEAMSLRPIAVALGKVLGRPVAFAEELYSARLPPRLSPRCMTAMCWCWKTPVFTPGEEKTTRPSPRNSPSWRIFHVNDAFSTAHRAHAGAEGVTRYLPSFAGRLMQAELHALEKALGTPARPVAAIVAARRFPPSSSFSSNLVGRVDILVIGGAMANTFLAAQGHDVGISLQEKDLHATALEILDTAHHKGCEIILPIDVVVAEKFAANAPTSCGESK